jgi:flagellar basal body-associated protein FliL
MIGLPHRGKTRVLFVVLMVGAALSAAGGGYLAARSAGGFGSSSNGALSGARGRFEKHEFVKFGTAVVNLAEGKLTRYLKVTLVLEVEKKHAGKVKKVMEGNTRSVFQHWLISYLSDLKLEDVKGAQSISRIRSRICEGFNKLLQKNHATTIENVLFREFSVQ